VLLAIAEDDGGNRGITMFLPPEYVPAWLEPVVIAAVVVFVVDLIGNMISFSNRFVNALVTALVFAVIFGTLSYLAHKEGTTTTITVPAPVAPSPN
jgi:hypothetical protein